MGADDDDGIVCQWQSDHYHDNDFDSESDLDGGAESDDEHQGACTHISVAYLVRAVDKFLDVVLSGGEVCLFARMHIGPKRWDEWLWLADLEGTDLFLAKQWLLEQVSPPRVYESEDDSDSESESGELIGDLHDDEYDPDDQFLSAYLRFRAAFMVLSSR